MSDEEKFNTPQPLVNRVIHKLDGTVKKYTVVVHMKTGRAYEVQADKPPGLVFSEVTRSVHLLFDDNQYTVLGRLEWDLVEFLFCEQNPGWKES